MTIGIESRVTKAGESRHRGTVYDRMTRQVARGPWGTRRQAVRWRIAKLAEMDQVAPLERKPPIRPSAHCYVYFIQAGVDGPVKVGVARDPVKRVADLQGANAETLRLVKTLEGDEALERELHQRFAAHRIRGEWFENAVLTQISDQFSLVPSPAIEEPADLREEAA